MHVTFKSETACFFSAYFLLLLETAKLVIVGWIEDIANDWP